MNSLNIKPVIHKGENLILISFLKNDSWNSRMKNVPGAKWSRTLNGWTIPNNKENRQKCKLPEQNAPISLQQHSPGAKTALIYISSNNNKQMQQFLQHLHLKAYSASTIRTYRNEFRQLMQLLGNINVQDLQPRDLQRYLLYCFRKGISENTIHSRINALKFYYEQVLHKEKMFFEIPRPKKPLQLPKVLSKEEIAAIIKAIKNVKHKTMIMLAYGCGLRVSEVTALQLNDIDGQRRLLIIRRGKGKKDRVISLSPALLIIMREYYRQYKPKKFFLKV